jgi:hypothetical protein
MDRRLLAVTGLVACLGVGCTGTDDEGSLDPIPVTEEPSDPATTSPSAPSRTPTPSPTPTPEGGEDDVAFGTGTITVDGTELPVSGDCDISRAFGEEPVEDLEEVDVLLAVDNIAGNGAAAGPFAVQVRLLGSGAILGRTITSVGVDGGDGQTAETTYEGEVEVAELRDRRELEFLDVAVLHLESSQRRASGSAGPETRELVVDVTCPISRPE